MRSAGPMARTLDDLIDLYRVITRPIRGTPGACPTRTPPTYTRHQACRTSHRRHARHGPRHNHLRRRTLRRQVRSEPHVHVRPFPRCADVRQQPYQALNRPFQVRARTEWESIPTGRRSEVLLAVADWASGAANYTAAQFSRDTDALMRAQEIVRAKTREFDFQEGIPGDQNDTTYARTSPRPNKLDIFDPQGMRRRE